MRLSASDLFDLLMRKHRYAKFLIFMDRNSIFMDDDFTYITLIFKDTAEAIRVIERIIFENNNDNELFIVAVDKHENEIHLIQPSNRLNYIIQLEK